MTGWNLTYRSQIVHVIDSIVCMLINGMGALRERDGGVKVQNSCSQQELILHKFSYFFGFIVW